MPGDGRESGHDGFPEIVLKLDEPAQVPAQGDRKPGAFQGQGRPALRIRRDCEMMDSLIQFVNSFIITFFSAASLYSLYSIPLAYAIGGVWGFVLGYYYKSTSKGGHDVS